MITVTHNTLAEAEDIDVSSGFLLTALLENEELKIRFINRLADRLNTSFSPQHVLERIDRMHNELAPEMEEHIRRWGTMDGSIDTWEQNIDVLREFARQRPAHLRQQIIKRFNLPGTVFLKLQADPEKGTIRVNSVPITGDSLGVKDPDNWTGIYFKGIPIQIKAIPHPGYAFTGWEGVDQAGEPFTLEMTQNLTVKAIFTALPNK